MGLQIPLNRSFFVWEPPGEEFDDLLLWMTREELSVAVPGNIPPLPRMIIPFFSPIMLECPLLECP